MITYLKGNLLESPAQVLTNTVNTEGVMGKGLALQFKNKFPAMFQDYVERCKKKQVKLGEPYLWQDSEVQILNFPTKGMWRENSKIEDIENGLKYIARHYQEMGVATLALPALGCGLGRLNWQNVRGLIEKNLGSLPDIEVAVYEPMIFEKVEKAMHGSKSILRGLSR